MTWQPRWPQTGAGTKAEAGAADRLAAEAGRLRAAADTREGPEAAAEACRRVLAVDPGDNGSHLALAHLHLLLGDAYSIRVADKRANFRRAMEHAESAMFANAGFRERVQQRAVHAPAGRSRLARQHRDEPERRVAGGRGLEESFIEVMPGNRGRGDPGRS